MLNAPRIVNYKKHYKCCFSFAKSYLIFAWTRKHHVINFYQDNCNLSLFANHLSFLTMWEFFLGYIEGQLLLIKSKCTMAFKMRRKHNLGGRKFLLNFVSVKSETVDPFSQPLPHKKKLQGKIWCQISFHWKGTVRHSNQQEERNVKFKCVHHLKLELETDQGLW